MREDVLGDPEHWLEAHGAALYRYALARMRDEHKAEEVVQETLVSAFEARSRFNGNASVRTWLIGILKHKIMDAFRRDAREIAMNDPNELDEQYESTLDEDFGPTGRWREKPADWGNPEELLERDQFMRILQRCLDALPKRMARLFWLREVMEEDADSVCQELSISATNLWTMLYRARLGLRVCLEKNWTE